MSTANENQKQLFDFNWLVNLNITSNTPNNILYIEIQTFAEIECGEKFVILCHLELFNQSDITLTA